MKRFFFLLLMLLAVACSKERSVVMVTFSLPQTKAFPDAIVQHYPDMVSLTLTNKQTSEELHVFTGIPAEIPVGEYAVTGSFEASPSQPICGFPYIYLSYRPSFTISADISVVEGVSTYYVGVTFTSFVLAIENSTTWTMTFNGSSELSVEPLIDGDVKWIFCTGDLSSFYISVHTDAGDFKVCTSAAYASTLSGNVITCSPGRWYFLQAGGGQSPVGTGIMFNWPEWTSGQ